jgi:hypothetical protein
LNFEFQRANQALSQRLCVYENAQEQGRRKEEGQRYLDAEREAALKSNRRTFQRVNFWEFTFSRKNANIPFFY